LGACVHVGACLVSGSCLGCLGVGVQRLRFRVQKRRLVWGFGLGGIGAVGVWGVGFREVVGVSGGFMNGS
jgi:hypothetical protein